MLFFFTLICTKEDNHYSCGCFISCYWIYFYIFLLPHLSTSSHHHITLAYHVTSNHIKSNGATVTSTDSPHGTAPESHRTTWYHTPPNFIIFDSTLSRSHHTAARHNITVTPQIVVELTLQTTPETHKIRDSIRVSSHHTITQYHYHSSH